MGFLNCAILFHFRLFMVVLSVIFGYFRSFSAIFGYLKSLLGYYSSSYESKGALFCIDMLLQLEPVGIWGQGRLSVDRQSLLSPFMPFWGNVWNPQQARMNTNKRWGLQIPRLKRSNIFWRRIANPPERLAEDFIAKSSTPPGARRIWNPP